MAKNWAIIIGINHYSNLKDLDYAIADATAMEAFFQNVGFEKIFRFTDDSQHIAEKPTYGNLRRFLREMFETPRLKPGDNLWFFFAGHGVRYKDRDYLMLSDSDPGDPEATAISVGYAVERLRRWQSDNVMLFLDACRSEGGRDGLGIGEEKHQGVITFYSCRDKEKAWEIEALQRGAFTHALIEALENPIEGNCATVARLDDYLRLRVPQINQKYQKSLQFPHTNVEPLNRGNLIILPHYIRPNPEDLAALKNDAWRSESKGQREEARRLWIRVNLASAGTDEEALEAIERLANPKRKRPNPPLIKPENSSRSGSDLMTRRRWLEWAGIGGAGVGLAIVIETLKWLFSSKTVTTPQTPKNSPVATSTPQAQNKLPTSKFPFEVVTVNRKGEVIKKEDKEASCFTEDLGNNIFLEMVYIPGGTFWMGTEDGEIERLVKKFNWEGFRWEQPRHEVILEPFFMSKYPITQAQWRAIATLPKIGKELKSDPSYFKGNNRSVEQVSWYDGEEFCKRLSQKTGREYKLPSEARWEYACRAGTTTSFYFGETLTAKLANYDATRTYAEEPKGEYRQRTIDVGQFPPNSFGLYDLHGNLWEWCEDDWHENYQGAPSDGSAWIDNDNRSQNPKCLRGGSWYNYPDNCRSALRRWNDPDNDHFNVGFRVACAGA